MERHKDNLNNRPFKPVDLSPQEVEELRGIYGLLSQNKYIPSTTSTISDKSQYDNLFTPNTERLTSRDEYRAQRQSILDRWGNAAARTIIGTGAKTAAIPGYLYGITESLFSDKPLSETLNNAWVNHVNESEEEQKKFFEIYTPDAVKNGNIFDNLWSSSFWANEGSDALSFLLSAYSPGGALRVFNLAGKLSNVANISAKTGRAVEFGSSVALNTLYEAGVEAKSVSDELKNRFQQKLLNNEINPATGKPWTKQEVDEKIADATSSTFNWNLAILLGPSILMNKMLFGRLVKGENEIVKHFTKDGFNVPLDLTRKQKALKYLKDIELGMFSEGLWEEGMQSTISNLNQKLAENNESPEFLEYIKKVGGEYVNTINSLDGQKSIVLGSVMGMLGGVAGGYREVSQYKELQGLVKILKNNFDGFASSLQDIIVVDPQTSEVKINEKALTNLFSNYSKEQATLNLADMALLNDNKDLHDYLVNESFTRFAVGHFGLENSTDILKKLNTVFAEKISQEKQKIDGKENEKADLNENVNKLNNKIDALKKQHDYITKSIKSANIETGKNIDKNTADLLTRYVNKVYNSALQEVSRQMFFTEKINEKTSEILKLKSNIAEASLPQTEEQIKKLEGEVKEFTALLEESKENYKDLLDKKKVKKAYDVLKETHLKNKKEEEEKSKSEEKKVEEKTDTTKSTDPFAESGNKDLSSVTGTTSRDVDEIDQQDNNQLNKVDEDNIPLINLDSKKAEDVNFKTISGEVKTGSLFEKDNKELYIVSYDNSGRYPVKFNNETNEYEELINLKNDEDEIVKPDTDKTKGNIIPSTSQVHKGSREFTTVFNPQKNIDGKIVDFGLNTILSSTPDIEKRISLRVTYSDNKNKVTPIPGRPNITNYSADFKVEILLDGDEVIGYLPHYKKFADKDGKPIIIDSIDFTQDKYYELFGFGDRDEWDKKFQVANFKQSYERSKNFYFWIVENIKDKDELIISNKELNELGSTFISPGIFNKILEVEELVDLNSHDKSKLLIDFNGTKKPLFIEIGNIYDSETGLRIGRKKPVAFGDWSDENTDLTNPEILSVLDTVDSLKDEIYSSYLVLEEDAGGTIKLFGKKYSIIPLTPSKIVDVDSFEKFLKKESERLKSIKESGKGDFASIVKEVNKKIQDSLFLSSKSVLIKDSDGRVVTKEGNTYITLEFGIKSGDLLVNMHKKQWKSQIKVKLDEISIDEIVKVIRKNIDPKFSANDFRNKINPSSVKTSEELNDLIDKFATLIKPNIKLNRTLNITFDKVKSQVKEFNGIPLKPKDTTTVEQPNEVTVEKPVEKTPIESLSKDEIIKQFIEYENIVINADKYSEDVVRNANNKINEFNSIPSVKKIIDELNDPSGMEAFKLGIPLNDQQKIDLEKAKRELSRILPGFISVQEMVNVFKNIENGNITFGEYKNFIIKLNKDAPFGTEYHEAFHAIFRTTLTDAQINRYYKLARNRILDELKKSGKNLASELSKFSKEHPSYKYLSEEDLKYLYYEEWMAKEFEESKKNSNKDSGFLEWLFSYIKRFFNFITDYRFSSLEDLFDKINRGGFKNSTLKRNKFLRDRLSPVYSLVPKSFNISDRSFRFEEKSKSITRINTLTLELINKVNEINSNFEEESDYVDRTDKFSLLQVLDDIFSDKLKEYTNLEKELTEQGRLTEISPLTKKPLISTLREEKFIYSNPLSKKILGEEVIKKYLKNVKTLYQIDNENTDKVIYEEEKTKGENQFGSNLESQAGFDKKSQRFREYISRATFVEKDEFGIEREYAVDSYSVYNSLVRGVQDSVSMMETLKKLIVLYDNKTNDNKQLNGFLDYFFDDINLEFNEEGDISFNPEKEHIINLVIKNIMLRNVDYHHGVYDFNSSVYDGYDSNRRKEEDQIFTEWNNYFSYLEDSVKVKNAEKALQVITNILSKRDSKFDEKSLLSKIDNFKKVLDEIGIKLSEKYIRYIILSSKADDKYLTQKQKYYLSNLSNTLSSFDNINQTLKYVLETITNNGNPFIRAEEIEDEKEKAKQDKLDSVTRLKRLAKESSKFNEHSSETSFLRSDKKRIYSMQYHRYFSKVFFKIKNEIDKLVENDPFLEDNYLVKNKTFRDNLRDNPDSFELKEIGGGQVGATVVSQASSEKGQEASELIEKSNEVKQEGVSYGDFTDRDFLLNALNVFVTRTKLVKGKDGKLTRYNGLMVRVLESSNTGYMVTLPFVQSVDNNTGEFTEEYLDNIYNEIEKEFQRIKRIKEKHPSEFRETIKDYNTGKMLGEKFWDTSRRLLSKETLSQLESLSTTPKKIKSQIIKDIKSNLQKDFDLFIKKLEDFGLIERTDKNEIINSTSRNKIKLDKRFFGEEITGKKEHENNIFNSKNAEINLKQMFFSNFFNRWVYTQLEDGDFAKKYSSVVAYGKRSKSHGNGGMSSETLSKKNIRYSVLPSLTSQDGIKIADSNAFASLKLFKYLYEATGNSISKELKNIFDKIERRERLSYNEVQKLNSENVILNPQKYAGHDGRTTLKMSVAYNDPSIFSYIDKDTGEIKPLPEHEDRFKMYINSSDVKDDGIDLYVDENAVKTYLKNQSKSFDDFNINDFLLDYFFLQQESPSGKDRVTDGTQKLNNIGFEHTDPKYIKLAEEYDKTLAQRVAASDILNYGVIFRNLKNEGVQPYLGLFQKQALEIVRQTGGNQQIEELLQLDEKGNPKFNPNIPSVLEKYSQIFLSHFKTILSQKTKGDGLILQSDFGIGVLVDKKGNIIRRDEFQEFYQKTEGITSRKLKYNQKEKVNGKIIRYSEVIIPKVFAEYHNIKPGDEIPIELLYMYGSRIPYTDKHSGHVLKVVDFIEGYNGNTIIAPEQLIKVVGHDFDFDKFYTQMYDYYTSDDGNIQRYNFIPGNDKHNWMEYLIYNTSDNFRNNKFLKLLIDQYKSSDDEYNKVRSIYNSFKKEYKTELKLLKSSGISKENRRILSSKISDGVANFFGENSFGTIDEVEFFLKQKEKEFQESALYELGLPWNLEEFTKKSKGKDINPGSLNNKILDLTIELVSNPEMEDIQNTPEETEVFKEIADFSAKLKGYSGIDDLDTRNSVHNELGLMDIFESNKSGSRAIGAAVNSSIAFSFFHKNNIKLSNDFSTPIIIGDKSYNSFSELRTDGIPESILNEINNVNGNYNFIQRELRKMEVFSSGIATMTDNPNLQYASKLNLTTENIGVFSYMVMKGLNPLLAGLIINSEIVKLYTNQTKGANLQSDFEAASSTFAIEKNIRDSYQVSDQVKNSFKLTPESVILATKFSTDSNILNDKNVKVDNDQIRATNLAMFDLYLKMKKESQFLFHLNDLLKLTKSFDSDFESLDNIIKSFNKLGFTYTIDKFDNVKIYKKQGFDKMDIPFDISPALKEDSLITQNIKSVIKLYHNLKYVFIERTPLFKRNFDIILNNLSSYQRDRDRLMSKISSEMNSFLIMRALRKSNPDFPSNEILYKSISDSKEDIVSIIQRYKKEFPDLNNNMFIKMLNLPIAKDNSKITFNSNILSNPQMRDVIIDSFSEIYFNPETRELALKIFDYLSISDGLLYKSMSPIVVQPGIMFKNTSKITDLVQNLLSKENATDEEFIQLFGKSKKDLFSEFRDIFFRDFKNRKSLNTVKYLNYSGQSINFNRETKELKIDQFGDVGWLTSTTPKEIKDESIKKLKENQENIKKSYVFKLVEVSEGKYKIQFPEYVVTGGYSYQSDFERIWVQPKLYKIKSVYQKHYGETNDNQPWTSEYSFNEDGVVIADGVIYQEVDFIYDVFSPHARTLEENIEATNLPLNKEKLEQLITRKRKNKSNNTDPFASSDFIPNLEEDELIATGEDSDLYMDESHDEDFERFSIDEESNIPLIDLDNNKRVSNPIFQQTSDLSKFTGVQKDINGNKEFPYSEYKDKLTKKDSSMTEELWNSLSREVKIETIKCL